MSLTQGVAGVDDQAVGGLAGDVAADPEERVLDRDRVARVARRRPWRADGQQRVGVGRARVEQQAVDPDAVDVGDLHGVDAVLRDQGREADAEHDGVRVGDVDRLVDVVDAGGEEQVAALGQGRVDLAPRCSRASRRRTGSSARTCPASSRWPSSRRTRWSAARARTRGSCLRSRRRGTGRRVTSGWWPAWSSAGWGSSARARRSRRRTPCSTPSRSSSRSCCPGSTTAAATPGHLAGDLGVGDVAAAGVAVAGRVQLQAAVDVHPAERPGLGHGPAVATRRTG